MKSITLQRSKLLNQAKPLLKDFIYGYYKPDNLMHITEAMFSINIPEDKNPEPVFRSWDSIYKEIYYYVSSRELSHASVYIIESLRHYTYINWKYTKSRHNAAHGTNCLTLYICLYERASQNAATISVLDYCAIFSSSAIYTLAGNMGKGLLLNEIKTFNPNYDKIRYEHFLEPDTLESFTEKHSNNYVVNNLKTLKQYYTKSQRKKPLPIRDTMLTRYIVFY
jgi:hypothetical protein